MKTLLPIGSVVRLQEGEKSLLIIGILQLDDEGNEYDYIACLYPEGYIDADTFFLFNTEDIADVRFVGLVDAEMQLHMESLHQVLDSMENQEGEESEMVSSGQKEDDQETFF